MEEIHVNRSETSPYFPLLAGYIAGLYKKPGETEKAIEYSMTAKGDLLPEIPEDTEKMNREKIDVLEKDIIQFIHNGTD